MIIWNLFRCSGLFALRTRGLAVLGSRAVSLNAAFRLFGAATTRAALVRRRSLFRISHHFLPC